MSSEILDLDRELDFDRETLINIYKNNEDEFTSLNRLATQICGTPVSLVNFLNKNFQYTISKFGEWAHDRMAPKQHTVCQYTIEDDDLLIINSTMEDDRTREIKELVNDQSVRFYAGMPIKAPGGAKIGAICVLDFKSNDLSEDQKQALRDLAAEVECRLKLYKESKKLEHRNKVLNEAAAFLNNSTDILWVVEPESFKIIKSNGAEPIFEIPDSKVIGKSLFEVVKEINIQKHIQNWIHKNFDHNNLGIPVQLEINASQSKWLYLTFSKFKGNLLVTGKDITKQHQAEERVKESLKEKEILLAEVHHRVKNNLAVVISLLQLERMKTESEALSTILLNSEARIVTIAKIHELLYKTHNFSEVDTNLYISDLIDYLKQTVMIDQKKITIDTQISKISLNVNQALPMGLIINELITNSLKHAFLNNTAGTITVMIIEKDNDVIHFEVSDDGAGMEIDADSLEEKGNLGFTLLSTLSKQLNAAMNITAGKGTRFQFKFKKNDKKGSVSSL